MSWLWPNFLLLLGALPLIVLAYILVLRRRRRFAVRYSSLSLLREAQPRHSWLRRHLPFALFLLALGSLVVALARPVSIASVPTSQTVIVLAIDVSLSMIQDDISPTRIEAAQNAAIAFIERQKPGTRIGIVAFAGFAEMVQPPTDDRQALKAVVESLTVGRGTAIGSGILKSIDVIADIDSNVAPSVSDQAGTIAPTPVPKGAYAPDIIVVLTDGVTTTGIPPLDAAQQAVDRGVRVYTIGFGTGRGSSSFGGGGPGGGGGGQFGGRFRRGIDEETLKQVAKMTDAAYYSAESAGELQQVFENLPTYLIMKYETTEISVAFTAIGALMAALAVVLSLRWNPLG